VIWNRGIRETAALTRHHADKKRAAHTSRRQSATSLTRRARCPNAPSSSRAVHRRPAVRLASARIRHASLRRLGQRDDKQKGQRARCENQMCSANSSDTVSTPAPLRETAEDDDLQVVALFRC